MRAKILGAVFSILSVTPRTELDTQQVLSEDLSMIEWLSCCLYHMLKWHY